MKIIFKIIALFLCMGITATAQSHTGEKTIKESVAEIPTMLEWWRANGISNGKNISYLPNFKDGHDAIAISTASNKISTWLNRFPGDTANVFTWADTREGYNNYSILFGDFNGDGIRDYIDGAGNIYRGIQNGQPPENIPVRKYSLKGLRRVFDFNSDGFDDIYEDGTTILYGGNDLKNLTEDFGGQSSSDSVGAFGEIYKTIQGEFRFIVQNTKAKVYDGYELYRATWQKGGTKPKFEKLDSVKQFIFGTQKDFFYINGYQTLYQSKKNSKPFFIATESLDGNWSNIIRTNIIIFDLSNDRFTEHLKFRMDSISSISVLEHSIDGDEYEDWYLVSRQSESSFFSGGERLDSIVRMKARKFQMGNLVSIKDVSGDDINDIAIGYYDFGIVKGMSITPDDVNKENQQKTFSFSEPMQQPFYSSQISTVPVSIIKPDVYSLSLYNIEGKQIAQIFNDILDLGTHRIPLNLIQYSISSGSYILRLSNGTQSIERTIIITN